MPITHPGDKGVWGDLCQQMAIFKNNYHYVRYFHGTLTSTAILHLPNYTASSQIKDSQPIVRIPSHPTIHADPPPGWSTRTEPNLQRHPYTNEAKERVMPNSKIVGIPSHPTIRADPPSGGSTRTESDLQRHPYTNEAKERVSYAKFKNSTHTITSHHPCRSPIRRINTDGAWPPTSPLHQWS